MTSRYNKLKEFRKRDKRTLSDHVRELNIEDEKIYTFLIGALNQLMSVNVDAVFDKSRKKEVICFRHALRYNLKKYTKLTLQKIGYITHKIPADHATIINSLKAWENLTNTSFSGTTYKRIQDKVETRTLDFLRFNDPNKKHYLNGIGFDSLHEVSVWLWKEKRIRFDF